MKISFYMLYSNYRHKRTEQNVYNKLHTGTAVLLLWLQLSTVSTLENFWSLLSTLDKKRSAAQS